jgi:hypothetical protein
MEDINIKHSVEFTNSSLENALSTLTDAISRFSEGTGKSNSEPQRESITTQEKSNIRLAEHSQKIAEKIKLIQENSANNVKLIEDKGLQDKLRATEKLNLLNATTSEKLNLEAIRNANKVNILKAQAQDKISQSELNSALRIKEIKEKQELSLNALREKNTINDQRSWQKFSKGLVLGGILSTAYMSNQFGSTAGKEAGSLNQSASNYLGFQQNLYNMQLQNQNNLVTSISGVIGGILGGITGSIIPGVGTAFGASAGSIGGVAIGGYLSGKNTEQDKARYEYATNKEFQAWQLEQMGISGESQKKYLAGGNISGLNKSQFGMTNLQDKVNATGAYADSTLQFALHGRRDIINRMTNTEIANFGKKAQQSAMSIGADPISFMNAITQTASVTGKSTNDILKQTMENARKYGGDSVSNLAKIVQLIQTTPLGQKGAENLINTYQYNDAMIKNKVNASTADPFGIFKSRIMMQIAGASDKEMDSVLSGGVMPSRLKNIITRGQHGARNGNLSADSINAELLMMGAGAIGVNPFVNASGSINPSIRNPNAITTAPDEPSTLKDMSTMVANQLQQIIVNGNISLSGNINYEQNKSNSISSIQDSLKMNKLSHSGVSSGQGVH